MKTVTILLAALALVVPAHAEEKPFTKALVTPASVRYGYVYNVAKDLCFKVVDEFAAGRPKLGFARLDVAANAAGMNSDERSLLYLMCAMYADGAGLGGPHPSD